MQWKLHHVGIIVPFIEMADRFVEFFDAERLWQGDAPKYEAECVFVRFAGIRIEFIVPYGDRLKKFNRGRGGIHHLAVEAEGPVDEATEQLIRDKAAIMLEDKATAGASLMVNFIQPICTGGVLIEIVEPKGVASEL